MSRLTFRPDPYGDRGYVAPFADHLEPVMHYRVRAWATAA